MNKKFIQFVSDIHLEFYKKSFPTITPIHDNCYLALLGDIGYPFQPLYEKFLAHHSPLFKEILLIAGNHEYYSSKNKQYTITAINEKIYEICKKYPNITYLNNSSHVIGNTLFFGTTLWTNVQNTTVAAETMNDYSNIYVDSNHERDYFSYKSTSMSFGGTLKKTRIKKGRRALSPFDVREFHLNAVESIKETLIDKNHDITILSHHAPSFKLLKDSKAFLTDCYASDLEDFMTDGSNTVTTWLFGHLHHNVDLEIGYVRCVSNCMGYVNEKCEDFDEKRGIEFD